MSDWISVDEALPEQYVSVMVFSSIRLIAYLSKDGWRHQGDKLDYPVTHWQPLPEPPR